MAPVLHAIIRNFCRSSIDMRTYDRRYGSDARPGFFYLFLGTKKDESD